MTEQIAARDWHTRARVRILETTTVGSVEPRRERTFRAGQELEMVQWGISGRPVDRSRWWTDFDIDGAFIIKASKVEVVKVLDEASPHTEEQRP